MRSSVALVCGGRLRSLMRGRGPASAAVGAGRVYAGTGRVSSWALRGAMRVQQMALLFSPGQLPRRIWGGHLFKNAIANAYVEMGPRSGQARGVTVRANDLP